LDFENLDPFPAGVEKIWKKIGLFSGAPRFLKICSENSHVKRRKSKQKKKEIYLFFY